MKKVVALFRKRHIHILIAVIFAILAGLVLRQLVKSNALTASGSYSGTNFPAVPTGGYNSIEHSLTVENVTPGSSYFWSHQISFIAGNGGGYFGMQSGSRADQDRVALFSLWNTTHARGAGCEPFGGEGIGMHCGIDYNWIENRKYHLKVQKLETDANGTWWRATVQDTVTGITTTIGEIENPPGWDGIANQSVMWTELFANSATNCNELPYSKVRFSEMRVNGNIPSGPINSSIGNGDCSNTYITNVTDGVIQEEGSLPPTLPTPIRVNAGGPNYTDTSGNLWKAEFNYLSGYNAGTGNIITGTSNPILYQTYRFCLRGYYFPVNNGTYKVNLHFAETAYTSSGKRLMNVRINGDPVLSNFDVFSKVGANKADVESFTVPVSNNWVFVAVSAAPGSNNGACDSMISAIEVLTSSIADLTNDGRVDSNDLSILVSNYSRTVVGTTEERRMQGDIDGNGRVDGFDASTFLKSYGT